jgi:putative Mg2+ transporter-C (MgtC) family protein
VIVALGAALFVIVSKYGFADIPQIDGVKADVARVAANVSSGVGFLGAGIIFMKGDNVQGLTTAAGIWMTAAVGLAVGSGMYVLGIFCAVLIMVLQEVMHGGVFAGMENNQNSRIVVCMEEDPVAYEDLRRQFKEQKIVVKGSHIKRHKDGNLTYTFDVRLPRGLQPQDILTLAKECKDVKSIGI